MWCEGTSREWRSSNSRYTGRARIPPVLTQEAPDVHAPHGAQTIMRGMQIKYLLVMPHVSGRPGQNGASPRGAPARRTGSGHCLKDRRGKPKTLTKIQRFKTKAFILQ